MKFSIAIDGNEANTLQRVGSNVYAFSVLKELHKLTESSSAINKKAPAHQKTLKHQKAPDYQVEVLLSAPPVADMPKQRANWQYKVITPSKFWTMWALPLYLKANEEKFDVFYTPGHYAPSHSSIPIVSSVMDLAFLEYPKFFKFKDLVQLKIWTHSSVKRAKKVITISKHSLRMIHHHYKKPASQIEVAPPALNYKPLTRKSSNDRKKLKKLGIQEPYIVYLGTIQPRKNLGRVVKAYEKLREGWKNVPNKTKKGTPTKQRPPQLIIAGKIGWLSGGLIKQIARSKYQKDIVMTGFVTETEKRALLSWACSSIQLGLHEGFGIPALESLAFGTIPVVANSSSLPEVVGEAGFQVDPLDVEAIAEAIDKVCHLRASEKTRLHQLGKKQVLKFNWKKSAQTVLKVLRDAVAK